jgi:hypothetical protein
MHYTLYINSGRGRNDRRKHTKAQLRSRKYYRKSSRTTQRRLVMKKFISLVLAAAAYCAGLVIGEYDDWYMPSKAELDLLVEFLRTV